jgi:signal peptidase II
MRSLIDAEVVLKKTVYHYFLLILSTALILSLDQYTKWLVRSNLAVGASWTPWQWLEPYARVVHWQNTGVAFGMLQGMNTVFAALAVIVSIAILFFFRRIPERDWPLRLALTLQLGGALGNLIDRIQQGYVTDFVSVGSFAVWNVADACITVGVAVLILAIVVQELRDHKAAAVSADDGARE